MKVIALLFAFLAVATGFASPPSKDDPTIPGRTTYSGGMGAACFTAANCASGEICMSSMCVSANLGSNTDSARRRYSVSNQASNAFSGCAGKACTMNSQCSSCGMKCGAFGTCFSDAF